ncbi:MAG: thioredoxin family protein [Planctomycetaceae bacterium]
MRLLATTLAAVLMTILGATASAAEPASRVEWQPDLKAAHKLARQTNKPIMIVFGADWCTYCHKLERNVLNQPEMSTYINEHFVPVHLDFDDEQKVAEILEVKSLPCTVVISPNADLLGKFVGYAEAPKFAANLESAEDVYRTIQTAAVPGKATVQ